MSVKPDAERTHSLSQVLEDLLEGLDRGGVLDREALLAQHPEFSEELGPCLTALELMLCGDGADGDPSGEIRGRIGDFDLVREIGRGGMGVVYEAEERSLHRRVALKTLPFASTIDPRHLQRFRNEALAAAHLHHPHIVPVYSVGSERGVHYYAMQYVDGASVAELIAELREENATKDDGRDRNGDSSSSLRAVTGGSSVRSREYCRSVARLGVQAADALHHAHEQGVVHRDVKPANLLVDGGGELWVADFGLASFRNVDGPTITGDLVGTLRYMSPEQTTARRMPVDQRTDVYSLGVTLYELLTLEPAVTGGAPHEVVRNIALEDPAPPRRHNPAVSVALETIVEKAIAKRLEDRYLTARELAEDLDRYLEDRPVRARKPSLGARLAQWGRRHRAVVRAAAAALVVVLLSLAGATVAIARQRDEAVRQRGHALATLERLSQISRSLLTGVEEAIATDADLAPRLRPLLGTVLDGYRNALEGLEGEPDLGAQVAHGHRVLGRIETVLGRFDAAAADLDRAAALLAAADPADAAVARDRDAVAHDRRMLALARRQWAEMDRALQVVVAETGGAPDSSVAFDDRWERTLTLAGAGHFYAATGRTEAALDLYAAAIRIFGQGGGDGAVDREAARAVALIHEQMGLHWLERADVPALIDRTPPELLWEVVNAPHPDLERATEHFFAAMGTWYDLLEADPLDRECFTGYWRNYWHIGRLFWKTATGVEPGTVHPRVAGQVEREIQALEPVPVDSRPLTAEPRPFSTRVVFYGMGYEAPYNRWAVAGHSSAGGAVTGDAQASLFTLPGGTTGIQVILTLRFEGGDTLEIVTFGGEVVPVTGEERARVSFAVVGGTGRFEGAEGTGRASVYDANMPPPEQQHPSQAGLRLELDGDIWIP